MYFRALVFSCLAIAGLFEYWGKLSPLLTFLIALVFMGVCACELARFPGRPRRPADGLGDSEIGRLYSSADNLYVKLHSLLQNNNQDLNLKLTAILGYQENAMKALEFMVGYIKKFEDQSKR